jgi:hypothetical protein
MDSLHFYKVVGEFKNQIENRDKKEKKYVLLKLEEPYVSLLSEYLSDKKNILRIINQYNVNKSSFYETNGENWFLCITGYVFGAKSTGPKKIGLLAYKSDEMNSNLRGIKTKVFYNQLVQYGINSSPYPQRRKHRENVAEYIENEINTYLYSGINNATNYIKSEPKPKPEKVYVPRQKKYSKSKMINKIK